MLKYYKITVCDSQGCAALMHCVQRTKKERVESYKIFVSIVCQKRASWMSRQVCMMGVLYLA